MLTAGDQRRTEIDRLIELAGERFIIDAVEGAFAEIPLPELCAIARENGLFESPLGELHLVRAAMDANPTKHYNYAGTDEDNPLNDRQKQSQAARFMHPQREASPFSKRLKKHLGMKFPFVGRVYRFSKPDARTSTYRLEVVG